MQRKNRKKSGFAYCACAYVVNIDAHKGIEPLHKLTEKEYNTNDSNCKPWEGRKSNMTVVEFMKICMTLTQEQQRFITEVLTICNSKGIRPDKAWNLICRGYGIPTTYELDRLFQS